MSATLRVEDFTQNSHLFKITPPVIKVCFCIKKQKQLDSLCGCCCRLNPDSFLCLYTSTSVQMKIILLKPTKRFLIFIYCFILLFFALIDFYFLLESKSGSYCIL
jgi:hypothetical protein